MNYAARIERLTRELKNLNFVNQSGACSSSYIITSEGRKSETTMEDKVIVVVCGYPELYIHLRTFTKTGIHFATSLELPGRSPSHDAYSRLLSREFHAYSYSYSKVTVAIQSGPYPAQMVTAVTRSSPYPDQMVDHHLETTSTALNVSGDQDT